MPYSEPESNVPFGAILTYRGPDRDFEKFTYMSELYRCARDVLESALDGGEIPAENGADDEPSAVSGSAAAKPAPETALKFEKLSAAPYMIARAKVPGGWLLAYGNSSLVFYPDPEHAWNGESLG